MSVIGGYRYLIEEGGVKSLWRGNGVNVAKIIPETALRFAVYEEVKAGEEDRFIEVKESMVSILDEKDLEIDSE